MIACQAQPSSSQSATSAGQASERYTYTSPNYDGIGKWYMGREISHVMGHMGASWLERPEREAEERTDLLVKELELAPTDVVADIGAGTGYFTFRMAELLPRGKVIAVDIQPEMLHLLEEKRQQLGITNVDTLRGSEADPRLAPNSVDLILLVDVYHEFSHPYEMGHAMARALKPGGQVVLVEYRAEDPSVPIKRLHKMSLKQAKKEMKALGLELRTNKRMLPQQHMMFFEKP